MVAASDVVVCFLAALAHNILLNATSTVVVMAVVFTYWWYSSWILWLDSCEQVYMLVLLCSSIAANTYKLVSICDCSKHHLHFVSNYAILLMT